MRYYSQFLKAKLLDSSINTELKNNWEDIEHEGRLKFLNIPILGNVSRDGR